MWRCWSGALACRSSRRRSAESQIYLQDRVVESLLTHGEWRSLVAHPAGGRAVAGSNPVSPIEGKAPLRLAFCLEEGSPVGRQIVLFVYRSVGQADVAPAPGGRVRLSAANEEHAAKRSLL